jgi:hypothetical protein
MVELVICNPEVYYLGTSDETDDQYGNSGSNKRLMLSNHKYTMLKELRKHKIHIAGLDLAIFDLAGTLGLAYAFARFYKLNPYLVTLSSIPLSILVHNAVGVKTPLTNKVNAIVSGQKSPGQSSSVSS